MTSITVVLTPDEAAVVALVRRQGIFASDVDVVKVALFKLAAHFDVPMEPEIFALEQLPLFDRTQVPS